MMFQILSTEELNLLGKYDTPTICNIIELFDVRLRTEGYMDKRIKSCFPEMPPMVGYASTASFGCSSQKGDESYESLEQQVKSFNELPGPPIVVFEDIDDPIVGATFGEIMCTTYKTFGARGLITSGAGRDLAQVRAIGFPVFTNGTLCSHGYSQIPSINIPVHVGGLTINPGDLLHGDCNGVTTIPKEIAKDIAQICDQYVAAESIILDYLKSENATPKGLAEARKKCQQVLQKLVGKKK